MNAGFGLAALGAAAISCVFFASALAQQNSPAPAPSTPEQSAGARPKAGKGDASLADFLRDVARQTHKAAPMRGAAADAVTAHMRERAMARSQLRILAEGAIAGAEGRARPNQPLIAQPIVFNRAAALTEDLTAERHRRTFVIPAGAKLFIVATPRGDAHCLPQQGSGVSLLAVAYSGPWIPCYLDTDGDGRLDEQTSGGAPFNSVYMFAQGFGRVGSVVAPARAAPIAHTDGHRQFVAIIFDDIRTDRRTNKTNASFHVGASPDRAARRWTPIGGTTTNVALDANGVGILRVLGAQIEVRMIDARTIAYKVMQAMPEQPYGLTVRTYAR